MATTGFRRLIDDHRETLYRRATDRYPLTNPDCAFQLPSSTLAGEDE